MNPIDRRPWRMGWVLVALCPPLTAHAGCEVPLAQTVRDAHEQVSALHAAHPMELRWMREQLQLIDAACQRGADVEAAWRVEDVLSRVKQATPARLRLTAGAVH